MATRKYDKQVFAIRDGNGKSFWTQIGVGFVNADGSLNLLLNFLPTDLSGTTIQVRDPKPYDAKADHAGDQA